MGREQEQINRICCAFSEKSHMEWYTKKTPDLITHEQNRNFYSRFFIMKIYHKIRSFIISLSFDLPFFHMRKECSNIFHCNYIHRLLYQLAGEITKKQFFIYLPSFSLSISNSVNCSIPTHQIPYRFIILFLNWNGIFLHMSFGLYLYLRS